MLDQQALLGVGADVLLALLSHSSISSDIREAAIIDALERATITCQRLGNEEDAIEGGGVDAQLPHGELLAEEDDLLANITTANNKVTSDTTSTTTSSSSSARHTFALIPQMIRSLLSNPAAPPSARAISALINWASAANSPLALIAVASNLLLNSSSLSETIPFAALNNAALSIENSVTQSIQMLNSQSTSSTSVSLSELIAGLAQRNNGIDCSTPFDALANGPTNISIEPSTSLGIFGALECASGDTALSPLSPRRGAARMWNRDINGEVTEAITSLYTARVNGKSLPNAATLRLFNSGSIYSGDHSGGAVTIPLNVPFVNLRTTPAGGGKEIIPKFSYFSFSVTVDDSSWKPRDAMRGNGGVTSEAINVIPVCLTISSGGMELWRSCSLHRPGDTTRARVCVTPCLSLTIGIEPLHSSTMKENQMSGVVFPFLVFPHAMFESAIPGSFRAPRVLSYTDALIIPFESGFQFVPPPVLNTTTIKNDKISASVAADFLLARLSWLAELDAESARQHVLVTPTTSTNNNLAVPQRLGSLGGHTVISGGSGSGMTVSHSIATASASGARQKKAVATVTAIDTGGGIQTKDDLLLVRARSIDDSLIYRAKMALPATRAVAQTLAILVQTALAATIAKSVRQTDNSNNNGAVDLRPCVESIDTYRAVNDAKSLYAAAAVTAADTLRSVIILSHSLFVRAAAIGVGKVDSIGHNNCSCGGINTSNTPPIDITGKEFDTVIMSGIDVERLVKPSACCFSTLRESLVSVAAAGTGVDAVPALRTLRVLAASALDAAFSLTARDAGARRSALTESLSGGATLLFHLPALPPIIPSQSSPAMSSPPTIDTSISPTASVSPQVTPTHTPTTTRRRGWRSSMRSSHSRNNESAASASPTTPPSITPLPVTRVTLTSNTADNNNKTHQQIANFALYIQLEAQRAGFETEMSDVNITAGGEGGGSGCDASGIVQVRVVLPPTRTRAAVRFIENGIARAISRAGLGQWTLPRGSAQVPLFVERFEGAKGFLRQVAGMSAAVRLCLAVGAIYDHK